MNPTFSKYSGCGNTFLFFDQRQKLSMALPIEQLCNQEEVDGIIFLENSRSANFKIRIFNADGTEAKMCGNGMRCAKLFYKELGFNAEVCTAEAGGKIYQLEGLEDQITLSFPDTISWPTPLSVENRTGYFVNSGVPHSVFFIPHLATFPFETFAQKVRHHPHFSPEGSNVTCVEIASLQTLQIRTYERGVEAETAACGTGAVAAALAAASHDSLKSPIRIFPTSQEPLKVSFEKEENSFSHIQLTGPAKRLSNAEIFPMGISCELLMK